MHDGGIYGVRGSFLRSIPFLLSPNPLVMPSLDLGNPGGFGAVAPALAPSAFSGAGFGSTSTLGGVGVFGGAATPPQSTPPQVIAKTLRYFLSWCMCASLGSVPPQRLIVGGDFVEALVIRRTCNVMHRVCVLFGPLLVKSSGVFHPTRNLVQSQSVSLHALPSFSSCSSLKPEGIATPCARPKPNLQFRSLVALF